jgi:hypothetical protein
MRGPVVVAVSIAWAPAAFADDASDAAAQFERGRELVKQGQHADACPLFESSLKLVPALGTELNLALCWAEVGRLVDALALFEALVAKTADANQPQREALARDGLAKVHARVPRVKIDASALAPGARVQIDDDVVENVDEPVAIDPGDHVITADGAKSTFVVGVEGEIASVVLRPDDGDGGAATGRVISGPPWMTGDDRRRDRRYFWIAGGTAAGLLAIGTITGATVIAQKNAAIDRCDRDADGALICDDRGLQLLDRARTMSHVTTVMWAGGLAAGGAAVYFYLRGRRADRAVAMPWVTPSSAGIAWERSW